MTFSEDNLPYDDFLLEEMKSRVFNEHFKSENPYWTKDELAFMLREALASSLNIAAHTSGQHIDTEAGGQSYDTDSDFRHFVLAQETSEWRKLQNATANILHQIEQLQSIIQIDTNNYLYTRVVMDVSQQPLRSELLDKIAAFQRDLRALHALYDAKIPRTGQKRTSLRPFLASLWWFFRNLDHTRNKNEKLFKERFIKFAISACQTNEKDQVVFTKRKNTTENSLRTEVERFLKEGGVFPGP